MSGGRLDFTQMPPQSGYKYLLILFTRWVEAFSAWSEKAMEIYKSLLKEIIPWFGLPKSLQNSNRPSFIAQITQGLTMPLGIHCKVNISWLPQSSGKVEKMNHTLKKTWAKLYQETHEPWTSLLPIVLLRVCVAPKNGLRLSPFEMTSHRPFLTIDIPLDEELIRSWDILLI